MVDSRRNYRILRNSGPGKNSGPGRNSGPGSGEVELIVAQAEIVAHGPLISIVEP